MARDLGAEIRVYQYIARLYYSGGRISGAAVDRKLLNAGNYVLALGSYSRQMLAPLGTKAPIYPLKGYSITVPIINPDAAPVTTMLDETYKVAITRFDNRIRVGGMAEIRSYDLKIDPRK